MDYFFHKKGYNNYINHYFQGKNSFEDIYKMPFYKYLGEHEDLSLAFDSHN